ncbi:MAG: hypothetical protein EAX95_11350 [Candidatus Thorarchaeota archaeon]|nr:hypothetical protein [Candidatus Thorarchaeota archaeon]
MKKLLRVQLISLAFVSLMLLGLIPQAIMAGQVTESEEDIFPHPFEGYDLPDIYILYDSTDEMMRGIAESVHEVAGFRINGISLIPVRSFHDISFWLSDEPWIAVYAFNSDLDEVFLPDSSMGWDTFYKSLGEYKSTEHVVGMGNTLSLDAFLLQSDANIHHSESEVVDSFVLLLYDLWAIKELASQRAGWDSDYIGASEDLEKMVLQIYSDHFSEIFQRQFDPIDPVGELDEDAAEERRAAMFAEHAGSVNDAAYHIAEDGSLEEIPLDDLPENFAPSIMLTSESSLGAGDFILGKIPFLSGLRGPIGEVVDLLLDLLIGAGKDILAIPESALGSIMDVFDEIVPILGIFDDFDLDSPLKSLFNVILGEFPFAADMKGWLETIIKALFNLRNLDNGVEGIVGIFGDIIEGLLPSILPFDVMDFLDGILDFGGGLWDLFTDIATGEKGFFDAIGSYLMDNIVGGLLNKTLVALLGIEDDLVGFFDIIHPFISSIFDYICSFNFDSFFDNIGNKLLNLGLGILTSGVGQAAVDRVMTIFKLGYSIGDMLLDFNTQTTLQVLLEAIEAIIGVDDIIGDSAEFVGELMEIVQDFVEDPSSVTISDLNSQLDPVLDSSLTGAVTAGIKNIVKDTLAMVAWLYGSNFNPGNVPDAFDIVNGILAEFVPSELTPAMDAMTNIVKPVLAIIAQIGDIEGLKKMIGVTTELFNADFSDLPDVLANVFIHVGGTMITGALDFEDTLRSFGEIFFSFGNMIWNFKDVSFTGIMKGLLQAVISLFGFFPSFDAVPLDGMLMVQKAFFPESFDFLGDFETPEISEIVDYINDFPLTGAFDSSMVETVLTFLFDIKGIFTEGLTWILNKIFDWLTGQITPLLQSMEDGLNGAFGGFGDLLGHGGVLPIGIGEWSLFDLVFDLGIRPQFHINPEPFFEFIRGILLEGRNPFSLSSFSDFMLSILKFFEITPQFYAELGVSGFDSSKNKFMEILLDVLGVDFSFSGSAKFVLNLFSFRNGMWDWDEFFHIIEWGLSLHVAISKTITLLDFLTGGVGGGVVSKIASYIGLDTVKLTIWFGLDLDIVKKAATAIAAETSTMSLVVTIGASVSLGINLLIAAADLTGTLEIIFSFFQDFTGSTPMKILLKLTLTLKLKIRFLFWTWKKTWTWEPGGPWDLSPPEGSQEYSASGMGFDKDGDGLSDAYELATPGLDMFSPDTDGDGANDKLETQTMGSDPTNPDTDGDGLEDGYEWDIGTSPLWVDSDWDELTDFEEDQYYHTNPLSQDTDGDGLNDPYEIRTVLNMTGVWRPTGYIVVTIGDKEYTDRTDPLNPDTDGDGLVDGDEGVTGAYYGLASLYNDTAGSGFDPNPLIYNGGYTHPLDEDTDDDSYYQLYNGEVDWQLPDYFLMDMNDGAEIAGFWITIYDEDGDPERKQVFTNPCNPDTDGDTGITDRTPQPGMWINSDGYELAQTPPTDPTDGDSDDDGLLDGIEGVLNPLSNHTNPNDWDTDDDLLGDMQEILLGCDPRDPDTDHDMISDSEEFYTFFTIPTLADSDFDNVTDGEEVYWFHTNPLQDDSDGDFLSDGDEIFLYGSDPLDEDGDNDGLTDFEEIVIYGTNPFVYDSDGDGLSDGEEVKTYDTDPLAWDTDLDSITEPNATGGMTFPLSDYHEVMGVYNYSTNPTEPDTDLDGLSDALEMYLGTGEIPWMDPMPLNPLSNDTDNDLLIDGSELVLVNVSDIVYPYIAVTLVLRYNSSPVMRDTDNDTLIDYQEVVVFNTDPANPDTDGDTIPDWWEVWVYNTSALYNDTDGDQIPDYEEYLVEIWPYGPWPPSNWSIGIGSENEPTEGEPPAAEPPSEYVFAEGTYVLAQYEPPPPLYATDPTDIDSDDDWLPDGAEVYMYGSNPMDIDSDNDGTDDTYEFDTDFDGLEDGIEFKLGLQMTGGGILDPDSDNDGIRDGDEYYIYHTNPASADSDGDGLSDGFEIAVGSNPFSWSGFAVISPMHDSTVLPEVTISVMNFTTLAASWCRYRLVGQAWSSDIPLSFDDGEGRWVSTPILLAEGVYELEVSGELTNGTVLQETLTFTVSATGVHVIRTIIILTPAAGSIAYHDTDIRVVNLTAMESMWYRYRTTGDWSGNFSLTYDANLQLWYSDTTDWAPGTYELQVFGETPAGQEFYAETSFEVPFPVLAPDWGMIGLVIGLAFLAFVVGISFGKGWIYKTPVIGSHLPGAPKRESSAEPTGTAEEASTPEGTKEGSEKSTRKKSTTTRTKSTKKSGPAKGKKGGA